MADIRKILGANVSLLRKGRGWSQAVLAQLIGKSDTAIAWIETARSWPEYDTVKQLAIVLEVPEERLFMAPGSIVKPTIPEALAVLAEAHDMEPPKPKKKKRETPK